MRTTPCTRLTTAIYDAHSNRKAPGILSLLIDTERKQVYIIPPEKEHVDVVCYLLGVSRDEIGTYIEDLEKYVPVTIQVKNERITGLLVGVSGIEIGLRVRHTKEQLERARTIAWTFLRQGELSIADTIEYDTIVNKYQKK